MTKGFFTRSTSMDGSETALTPELLDEWIKNIGCEEGYPHKEPQYLCSPTEYKNIMNSKASYYKTMRQLLGIKLPLDDE